MKLIRKGLLLIPLLPVILFVCGAASNQLVNIANHDAMPVLVRSEGQITDRKHIPIGSDTHLNFLSDVFDLGSEYDSPGDLLIDLGEWIAPYTPYVWGLLLLRRFSVYIQ